MVLTKLLLWTMLLALSASDAWAQEVSGCGSLANAYGPYDYTNPTDVSERLPIVENAHFTPEVEALIGGNTGSLWGDLDYTLRAFPNHHRALYAAARYALRPDSPKDTGFYPAECYFRRAVAFNPSDGIAHMIYGIFLHKQDKLSEALAEYKLAVQLVPNSAETHYNLGLLYAEMRDYKNAKRHAQQAYALGYPLSGLKDKLQQAGEFE